MMKKRIIITLFLLTFLVMFYNNTLLMVNFTDEITDHEKSVPKLSGYWTLNPIHIDGNWSQTESTYGWCRGSGTWSDPYLIENVTIDGGYLIYNYSSCIKIENANDYFIIRNCTLYNAGIVSRNAGISLENVDNGKLIKNNCSFNANNGISLRSSNNNTIEENTLSNDNSGIWINDCFGTPNNVIDNILEDNNAGIKFSDSNNVNIFNNTGCKNNIGLYMEFSPNNVIIDNNFSDNNEWGIYIWGSSSNDFFNNEINDNNIGFNIGFNNCISNTVFNNEIRNNGMVGMNILTETSNNLVYGNFFVNNTENAYDDGINNSWDNGSLGNYWDDYTGNGTTPYMISGSAGSQDRFPMFNHYYIPGVNEYVPLEKTIKVGLTGDLNHFNGDHNWKGALLAATEINEAGGILINGSIYYIGLKPVNTYENERILNVTKSLNAVNRLIADYSPHFIIGGQRNDAVTAYLEPIMDAQIPFIITGASDDTITQNVLDDYNRYKYLFRAMPMNSSALATDWINFDIYLKSYVNSLLGRSFDKIALMYEEWNVPFIDFYKTILPSYGFEIVKEIQVNWDDTIDDFINYWNEIDNSGAQLASIGFGTDKAILMSQAYSTVKPRCLITGVNVYAQNGTYWTTTYGGCNYEITYQGYFNVPQTPRTIPFYNNFVQNYTYEPLYIATGAYDAINLVNYSISAIQSFDSSEIVLSLETINSTNIFPGAGGYIAFTHSHSLLSGINLAHMFICQWQSGGTKVVLPNSNLRYSDALATGSLQLPSWGINIHFTINSPIDNIIFEDIAPTFNIEILDAVDKIWYTINSGTEKYFITNNGSIDQMAWTALSDGDVKITFYANESSGEIYRRYVNIIKDTLPPNVTIEPLETTTFGSDAPTIILNIQDASNITESYYSLDGGVTLIPFTGNVVTINQTLWDELGEGTVRITFYIIDSVDRETIIYIDVYKDLPGGPGGEEFPLYIIIGVIALALGVMITITYTQYRRKKRRRTEWVKLKKKKGLISPDLADGKNITFISYATKDSDLFQIPLITDILTQYPEIDDILYWESDMHDDIYEYMDDNLKICSVFLLFCTQNSLYSEVVKMEWRSALKLDKKIIPIFINPNDIPPLLTTKLGVQFIETEVYDSIEKIYQMILKKLEIVSIREFCKYLIKKMVTDEYFEEQTAPMVKRDIEIESDVPLDDLQMQLISILEENNFQLLGKPNKNPEIEKSEERENDTQRINLRFYAEDKFKKQEIGLSVTIQREGDYQCKVYLRVMGNKEWMVDEILSDLGSKLNTLRRLSSRGN